MYKQARVRISNEELRVAVSTAASAAAALRRIGRVPVGGNYKTLYSRIRLLGLDTSHWLGKAHLRGKNHCWGKRAPLESLLVQHSSYRGWQLQTETPPH